MTNKVLKDFNSGTIDVLSTIIKHVMFSASEAETGALYYRFKRTILYRVALQEMGHPQSEPTPVTTDNNTAHSLTIGTMTSKASKSNDMRFQWLKCRKSQTMFAFLWAHDPKNCANYPSKHHHGPHHLHVRQNYVVDKIQPSQWHKLPPIYLYIHQVTFYTAECVTFFTLFYYFFLFISNIFQWACKTHLLARVCWYAYLEGTTGLPITIEIPWTVEGQTNREPRKYLSQPPRSAST